MTDTNQLVVITNQAGLAEEKSKALISSFVGYFDQAKRLASEAKTIEVTSVDQTREMAKARDLRLQLQKIRTQGVEQTRIQLKEQSLREGKAIDGLANVIKALIVPVEEHLKDQEEFAKRIEEQKKLEVEQERIRELSKYVEGEGYSLHPDKMSQETFDKLLEASKFTFEAQKKAEEDAEKARLAQIEADRKEQERVRLENEKLKAEAEKRERELALEREKVQKEQEAREAQLAKERAEQEAKLEAERQARLEAEEKMRKEQEARLEAERANAEKQRQMLLAPDREKLNHLADQLLAVEMPAVKSPEAMMLIEHVREELTALAETVKNSKL